MQSTAPHKKHQHTHLLVVGTVHTLRHKDGVQVLESLELSALLVGTHHHKHRQVGSETAQVLRDTVSGGSGDVVRHHDGGHSGVVSERRSLLGSRVG